MFRAVLILSLIYFVEPKRLTPNETAVLVSKYARVAKWGTNHNKTSPQVQRGRSSSGQALWAHRSDVNIISTHNKPQVVRQYPVYSKPSAKIDHVKVEKIPAVGEVVQDRFNARPYFGYGQIPPSNQDSATYAPASAPPQQASPGPSVADTPPASFPAVFNVAPASAKPPVDLYTSPYSSYNPPNVEADSSGDSFPPAPGVESYAAPPADDDSPNSYEDAEQSPKKSAATLGPPVISNQNAFHYQDTHDDHHHLFKEVDAPPSGHMGHEPDYLPEVGPDQMAPDDSVGMQDHSHVGAGGGPPIHPPMSIDDVYYPPDFPVGQDHPKAAEPMPPVDMTVDLSPPVPHEHFPKYLYDDPHFDHHIYEEVPHTTTQATEDKRVSSVNYSYYYLGRKLWYIPLYFSIYFMFYVTALILKSIARHKVELKHEWASSHSRSARKMTFDQLENVDSIHKNVTRALDTAQKIYDRIAM